MLDVEINKFKNIHTVSLFNGTYIEYCISEKTSNYMNATLILDNSCTATAITKLCKAHCCPLYQKYLSILFFDNYLTT